MVIFVARSGHTKVVTARVRPNSSIHREELANPSIFEEWVLESINFRLNVELFLGRRNDRSQTTDNGPWTGGLTDAEVELAFHRVPTDLDFNQYLESPIENSVNMYSTLNPSLLGNPSET